MAIVPSTKYTGQIDTSDLDAYPHGKAKNVVTAGDGSGTPLEKDWVNDLWGFLQSLLDIAGITPSGDPDEVGASDYLDAMEARYRTLHPLIAANLVNTNTSPFGTDVLAPALYGSPRRRNSTHRSSRTRPKIGSRMNPRMGLRGQAEQPSTFRTTSAPGQHKSPTAKPTRR